MPRLKSLICCLFIFSVSNHLYAFQSSDQFSDSADLIQKKIKNDLKILKNKKPQQIKRIVNRDSSIIYGADKKKTHIVLVHSYNRLEDRSTQFTYNEDGVIYIAVLKRPKNLRVKKEKSSAYYFDKGKLIYSENSSPNDDMALLIAEAERYLRLGNEYLNDH